MLLALIRLGLFGPIIVSGTFTCSGTDWVSDGSKCYKAISGSPSDGQNLCTNEDPHGTLILAPTSVEAIKLGTLFSGDKIWVGLRFCNGSEWFWDSGLKGPDIRTAFLPQLCIGVKRSGLMYDIECYRSDGVVCQKYFDVTVNTGVCEEGWTNVGNRCFKQLLIHLKDYNVGVNFIDARVMCSNENAFVMMPQSESEAHEIATKLNFDYSWVGLTNFDADHTYTWEDGTNINQSILYFDGPFEPNKRYQDNVCAYIQNGNLYIIVNVQQQKQ